MKFPGYKPRQFVQNAGDKSVSVGIDHLVTVDLVKVDLQSSKVTFLIYDDCDERCSSRLLERSKVDLRQLRVDFFDYTAQLSLQSLAGDPSEVLAAVIANIHVPSFDRQRG